MINEEMSPKEKVKMIIIMIMMRRRYEDDLKDVRLVQELFDL